MALNNIFNEPRREITETIVGISVIFSAVATTVLGGHAAFVALTGDNNLWESWVLGPTFLLMGLGITAALVQTAHWIGEDICDSFARSGREIRGQRQQ